MLLLSAKTFKIFFWWEDTIWKAVRNTSEGPDIPFGAMAEYHPVFSKDQSRLHQFGPKSLAKKISRLCVVCGCESGKETLWSQTLKNWRRWTHQKSTLQRSGNFIFPVADGTVQIFGRERRLRTSTVTRNRQQQGKEQKILQGKSDESHFKKTQRWMMRKLKNTSGLLQEISFIAITWNSESNCTCREKNHFLFRWNTSTLPERHIYIYIIECIVGENTGDCMDRLRMIHFNDWKAIWRIYMVWEETNEETNNLKTWQCMAWYVEAYVWCSEKESKAKVGYRETKVRECQTIEGIYSFEPDDEEFKPIMKNARWKLEVPMPAAMRCKAPVDGCGETCRSIGKRKTKYACIVDTDESMRTRLESVPQRYHEDHITAKGVNPLSHYNFEHKFIPMPQALKMPDAKNSGTRKGKTWKYGHGSWQVRNKKEVIDEARNKGWKVHFRSLMDVCHLKNAELEPQFLMQMAESFFAVTL